MNSMSYEVRITSDSCKPPINYLGLAKLLEEPEVHPDLDISTILPHINEMFGPPQANGMILSDCLICYGFTNPSPTEDEVALYSISLFTNNREQAIRNYHKISDLLGSLAPIRYVMSPIHVTVDA